MTTPNNQTESRTASDFEEVQDAMKQLHMGNLKYENYRRRVFITSEMNTGPLHSRSQSTQRRRAFTLNPGQGDSTVMLDSGEIAVRIGDHGSQFRVINLDTATEDEFSQIQSVMRKWAPFAGKTVRPLSAKRSTGS